MKVYLASYLGFSPEYREYLGRIRAHLGGLGLDVLDPWEESGFAGEIEAAFGMERYAERVAAFRRIAAGIGAVNERLIREADLLLAVLDGPEVDSGTAAELGFAAGLGKRCFGLRTDFRTSGDFEGIPVNLQVLHFIHATGGTLFRSIGAITF